MTSAETPAPEPETPIQAWTRIAKSALAEGEGVTDDDKRVEIIERHAKEWADFCESRGLDTGT